MRYLVNSLLIVASVFMVMSGARFLYNEYEGWYFAHHVPPSVKVGDQMGLRAPLGKQTLLLEVREGCSHCKANELLYSELSSLPKILRGDIQIVVAMHQVHDSEGPAFMSRTKLSGKLLTQHNDKKFGFLFTGTPSLSLLDPDGRVTKVWNGEVHDEKALLAELR